MIRVGRKTKMMDSVSVVDVSRVILADCCYTTPKLFLTSTWPALPWLRRPELPGWAESQEEIEGGLAMWRLLSA